MSKPARSRHSRDGGAKLTQRDRHRIAFAALVLVVVLWDRSGLGTGPTAQLAALAFAAAIGLPHGALDHLTAASWLRPQFGRFWLMPFLAGYAGLAGLVLLAWAGLPGLTLAAFLGLSVLHFGLGDADAASPWLRGPAVLAHGAAPVVVPSLVHPAEIGAIFRWLVGAEGAVVLDVLRGPAALAWTLATLILLFAAVRLPHIRASVLELLVVVAAFALLPPLLAFALYFGGLHSVRAILDEAEERGGTTWASVSNLLRQAAPLSLAALALAIGGFWLLQADAPPSVALTQSVFFALSALTVPHMAQAALISLTTQR